MPTTVEAIVDEDGRIRLLEPLRIVGSRRALVTLLDEPSPFATAPARDESAATVAPWTARYEPVRPIGSGGMSRVSLARDRQSGALVCVKELREDIDRTHLQQECRALARLRHPSVLRLITFETRGANPYLVTEFAGGVPLDDWLPLRVFAQQPLAAFVAVKLFEAIAAAHAEEVIHRDLKPQNVMIDTIDGVPWPKILDFGLAVVDRVDAHNAATGVGLVAGTLSYMAAEQIRAARVSGACDVYAVGQMCWEMLSGTAAFPGDLSEILGSKIQTDGLTLDAPVFGVADLFRSVIYQCTRLDPAERLHATDAAEALGRLIPPLPPQATLVPTNLGFSDRLGHRPAGWFDGFGYVGGVSMAYDCRIVDDGAGSPPGVRVQRTGGDDDEFGVLMQRTYGDHLAGSTVRLEASMRTDAVSTGSGLWLRGDGSRGMLAFENMHDRLISGTTPWGPCAIELALPEGTAWLNFGILQSGRGATDVRNLRLFARGRDGTWIPLGIPESPPADRWMMLT